MVLCRSTAGAGPMLTGRRLSTVVPGVRSGEGRAFPLGDMDLALKLHYLRLVYYFPAPCGDISTAELKHHLFRLLEPYYPVCARIRLSSSGQPFLKCNDCGVRFVEARCPVSMADWLEKQLSPHSSLSPVSLIGPDIPFSALAALQFTWFECGGLAMGLSWFHALGDAGAATNFASSIFRVLAGHPRPEVAAPPAEEPPRKPFSPPPLSVKLASALDSCWLPVCDTKMETLSVKIPGFKLESLLVEAKSQTSFLAISAFIWQHLTRTRASELCTVTVCKFSGDIFSRRGQILGNDLAVGVVSAGVWPAAADVSELARILAGEFPDESPAIGALAGAETTPPDLLLYGTNLSFVDLEDLPVYDVQVKGRAPDYVDFTIDGVGGEGCILVLPGERSDGGRLVNTVLPVDEVVALRKALEMAFA